MNKLAEDINNRVNEKLIKLAKNEAEMQDMINRNEKGVRDLIDGNSINPYNPSGSSAITSRDALNQGEMLKLLDQATSAASGNVPGAYSGLFSGNSPNSFSQTPLPVQEGLYYNAMHEANDILRGDEKSAPTYSVIKNRQESPDALHNSLNLNSSNIPVSRTMTDSWKDVK